MKDLQVKIKKLSQEAIIPAYAKEGDAGLDFTAVTRKHEDGCIVYGTGLAVEIPAGYVGLLFARSSIFKKSLILTNHVGVIDSGYRGEILFKFKEHITPMSNRAEYEIGERIGQMLIVPYPSVEFVEVDELSDSARGANGYGSSGK